MYTQIQNSVFLNWVPKSRAPPVSKTRVLLKGGCFKMDIDPWLICVNFSLDHTLLLLSP